MGRNTASPFVPLSIMPPKVASSKAAKKPVKTSEKESYATYVYKVLLQVHPVTGLLSHYNEPTISSREIPTSECLLLVYFVSSMTLQRSRNTMEVVLPMVVEQEVEADGATLVVEGESPVHILRRLLHGGWFARVRGSRYGQSGACGLGRLSVYLIWRLRYGHGGTLYNVGFFPHFHYEPLRRAKIVM